MNSRAQKINEKRGNLDLRKGYQLYKRGILALRKRSNELTRILALRQRDQTYKRGIHALCKRFRIKCNKSPLHAKYIKSTGIKAASSLCAKKTSNVLTRHPHSAKMR
jgi:hypothetical protein